ncbi:MAG: helix-turn-helix domain-containing protein [Rhodospirillaceae bacterium]
MTAPLLTPEAAARHLAVSTRLLRRLVASGTLPFVLVSRRKRFRLDDLEAFAESQLCRSTAAPTRRSGTTTSPSTVVDFEAARAKYPARPRS